MRVTFEMELNRAWIYDEDNEDVIIGETNFVIGTEYLNKIFKELFSDKYNNLNEFLEAYEPEIDGEKIYQRAKKENEITYEGVFYYEM